MHASRRSDRALLLSKLLHVARELPLQSTLGVDGVVGVNEDGADMALRAGALANYDSCGRLLLLLLLLLPLSKLSCWGIRYTPLTERRLSPLDHSYPARCLQPFSVPNEGKGLRFEWPFRRLVSWPYRALFALPPCYRHVPLTTPSPTAAIPNVPESTALRYQKRHRGNQGVLQTT